MFYDFQEGLRQTIDLLLELVSDDGIIRTYRAIEMEGQKKIHTLTYNNAEQSVYCSCRKFEFTGILCSHALKLFRDLRYKDLPPKYYLKRWTRKATDEDVFDPSGELIPNDSDPSSSARYNALLQISQRIVTKGSKSEEVFALTNSLLLEVEARMEERSTREEQRPTVKKTTTKTNQNQEASGLPQVQQQQPSYSQTGWRWMNQRVVHPQGVHPRDILPPYNTVPCQQRRPYLQSSLLAPQQESSSQIENREMPH